MITQRFITKTPRLFAEELEKHKFTFDYNEEGFVVSAYNEDPDWFAHIVRPYIILPIKLEYVKEGETYFAVIDKISFTTVSKTEVFDKILDTRFPRSVLALASVYNKNYDTWIEEDVAYTAEKVVRTRHLVRYLIKHPNGLNILWPTKYFRALI